MARPSRLGEGLQAMTVWVAEQCDEPASKGTLEGGKLAIFGGVVVAVFNTAAGHVPGGLRGCR